MVSSFTIEDSVALVTGTNKQNGIGRALVKALLDHGARKVYATARDVSQLDDLVQEYSTGSNNNKVVAIPLDVTDHQAIQQLPDKYPDVTLLVNNAGYFAVKNSSLDDIELARKEIEINYLAPMAMVKSYGTYWKDNNTVATAVVNINAITSLVNVPFGATYSAAKAAAHSLTQAQRRDLKPIDSLVIGIYPGPTDTDMTTKIPLEKASRENVAKEVIAALETGTEDVFPDARSSRFYQAWKSDAKALEMAQISAPCTPKNKNAAQ